MSRPEAEMIEAMRGIRDGLLDVIEQHEREEHDGQPCWAERANCIAYLCHSLGIQGQQELFRRIGYIADRYMDECVQRDCSHLKAFPY